MYWDLDQRAIGGVLRNQDGNVICLFSSPIPNVEINHAEILAIYRAIRIFRSYERLHSFHLIVESDSFNVVN